ncbi:MAG: DUF2065 domain-containing protein [Hyphomicrobiaceae bacterium]
MSDLIVALGLVLVIEGLLWAAFPKVGLRMLTSASAMPEQALRIAGALSIALGVLVVWLVRG